MRPGLPGPAALLALVLLGCGHRERNVVRRGAAPERGGAAPLAVLRHAPRPTNTFRALGLTGANKPNGIEYRFRESVPRDVPDYVPRRIGDLALKIADPTRDGWLAFYKGRYPPRPRNAAYRALLFAPGGEPRWDLDLNRFLSRPDHLEIQDIRYLDGGLYFNEACQSYSREAGGRCSALVRLDPGKGEVRWRTGHRKSNDVFIFHGPYVIAGYGFTNEPDSLFLVARESGGIAARAGLNSAPSYLEVRGGRLVVVTYRSVYEFALPAAR